MQWAVAFCNVGRKKSPHAAGALVLGPHHFSREGGSSPTGLSNRRRDGLAGTLLNVKPKEEPSHMERDGTFSELLRSSPTPQQVGREPHALTRGSVMRKKALRTVADPRIRKLATISYILYYVATCLVEKWATAGMTARNTLTSVTATHPAAAECRMVILSMLTKTSWQREETANKFSILLPLRTNDCWTAGPEVGSNKPDGSRRATPVRVVRNG